MWQAGLAPKLARIALEQLGQRKDIHRTTLLTVCMSRNVTLHGVEALSSLKVALHYTCHLCITFWLEWAAAEKVILSWTPMTSRSSAHNN